MLHGKACSMIFSLHFFATFVPRNSIQRLFNLVALFVQVAKFAVIRNPLAILSFAANVQASFL